MSRQIDFDKPLSADDREWLCQMSLGWRIEENERRFGNLDVAEQVPHEEHEHADIGDANTLSLEDEVAALDVSELKDELKGLKLPVSGDKQELQERLLNALREQ